MHNANKQHFEPYTTLQEQATEAGNFLVFSRNQVHYKPTDNAPTPLFSADEVAQFEVLHQLQVGRLNGQTLSVVEVSPTAELPRGWERIRLRMLFNSLPHDLIMTCGYASHLLHWSLRHRFCGSCGDELANRSDEKAKYCPNCQQVYYPEINPAIIVAIVREGKLLLAHSARFKKKFYSVVAGFVEMGESFEDTIHREVMEEVGVSVKNIRYFGSQPWPFPSSLMIGFTAEWAGGEITLNDDEIDDAGWYTPENMPPIPPTLSIAGRLIQWYLKNYQQ